ncbi:MAG: cob(I)yrinic acid a,c-diamide adenosyltransferase [Elusimicrobia bacterium]|nr:cob(I)yrinic acid a,c-diamide adenosyltransferase [Elusimicrobiota bacterium]
MKIYTRTGDKGETGLWGGERVPKTHARVCAYGEIDELNSCLGAAISALVQVEQGRGLREKIARIQEELFMIGALLATPSSRLGKLAPPFDRGLPADSVSRLEREIDAMTAELSPMDSFILPGGGAAGCWLHLARTICRRAERRVVELSSSETLPDNVLVYLNRLSDHLFTSARWINAQTGFQETPWRGLRSKKA